MHLSRKRRPPMPVTAMIVTRVFGAMSLLGVVLCLIPACAGPSTRPTEPPTPLNFAEILEFAERSALVYQDDATIRRASPPGSRISISGPMASGLKVYVETDDARRRQWIVVRGTANLANVKLDADYNQIVDGRLRVPLHKGFADAALQVYGFAKPLLQPGYDTRVTGHSLGGAAAVIVLMLLKEDGLALGPAITFGQPKVTNRDGSRTYRSLPLLRIVNDQDPVPLLPPFDLFSLLDEGPYQHVGPEVVLKDGTGYLYFSDHQAQRRSVTSFWNTLGNQDLPDHAIAQYVQNLRVKAAATR